MDKAIQALTAVSPIDGRYRNKVEILSDYFSEYKIQEIASRYPKAPAKWLDLGCGDGLTAFFIKKYFPF